jgi:mono/diheme cytochrome c family protein
LQYGRNWMRNPATWLALIVPAAIAHATGAGARTDAPKGAMLAAQICAKCHAIRPGQTSPKPEAPTFTAVAAKPTFNIFTLRSFISVPHWTSTNLNLNQDDSEDIAAYILSLQPRR